MATISSSTGSIHRGKVERRAQQLTVSACPAGPVWLTWGRVELGRGTAGQPIDVDLSVLPLGAAQITARWSGGSDTKSVTVVPDPKPGPLNTGCRIHESELAPWTGPTVLPAGVHVGLLITKAVTLGAGVTLRDSIVRPAAPGAGGLAVRAQDRAVLEADTVDGSRTSISIGVGYAAWTGRRLNISGCNDGARIATGAVLADSWVHHLKRLGSQHPDCVQTTGGTRGLVDHCTLDAWNPDTGDRGNAAVQIGGETAPLVDFTVRDCWLDGGNYAINIGQGDVRGPVTIERPQFGAHSRYGPIVQSRGDDVTLVAPARSDGLAVVPRYH